MKLSLKFQDDPLRENQQTRIVTAKLPITILNRPFVSGLTTTTANSASEIFFSLSTSFPSGPSLKLSYSPTSPSSSPYPFFLSLKSGVGLLGSPHGSPLVFSAKCYLSAANVLVPAFSLHFKPQLGHFSLRKGVSSNHKPDQSSGHPTNGWVNSNPESQNETSGEFANRFASDGSSVWQEVKLKPLGLRDELESPKRQDSVGNHSDAGIKKSSDDLFVSEVQSGVGVLAKTTIPVSKRLALKLRWGVNLPGERSRKMPYLTVNKIGIQGIEEAEEAEVEKARDPNNSEANSALLKDTCSRMERDMEVLERDNREMRQYLEQLVKWRIPSTSRTHDTESNGVRKTNGSSGSDWSRSRMNIEEEKGQKGGKQPWNQMRDLEAELQKAMKAAES